MFIYKRVECRGRSNFTTIESMGGWKMNSFAEGMRPYMCISKQTISRLVWVMALLALSLSMIGRRAAAQSETNGAIDGTVTDPQGLAVPRASVTIQNTGTGMENQAATDEHGL